MTGLLILVIGGLAAIAWWRLLQGKETARHAAAAVCREHGLVLMDDTVVLHAVQLKSEDPVRAWGLKYRFDFARNPVIKPRPDCNQQVGIGVRHVGVVCSMHTESILRGTASCATAAPCWWRRAGRRP